MLLRRGRVRLNLPLNQWIELALRDSGVICLPVEQLIALCAANLPEHHRDPADRLIIATALTTDSTLASLDEAFPKYEELSGRLYSR